MDSESRTIEQFWTDLISIKEGASLLKLTKDVVLGRLEKGAIRGKMVGTVRVLSRASLQSEPQASWLTHIEADLVASLWNDLISLREACAITGMHDDAMLDRLRRGKILGKVIGKHWVVSRTSAQQYTGNHEPRHKSGAVPGSEAAKRGPQALLLRYGDKWGEFMRQKHGQDYFHRIGVLGGNALKEKYGMEHYRQLGAKRRGKRKLKSTTHIEQDRQEH